MMKTIITILVMQLFFLSLSGTQDVASKIMKVTVYQRSAKITREASVNVPKGTSEVVLTRITDKVLANSLQVSINGNATLLSASYRIDYLTDQEKPEKIKQLQDSLEVLTYEIRWNEDQKNVYNAEEALIRKYIDELKSKNTGKKEDEDKDDGLTVEEFIELLTFYRNKLTEIKSNLLQLEKEMNKLNLNKNKIQHHLNELNAYKAKPTGEIVVSLTTNVPSKINIECSYLSKSAGWTPVYDLRASDTDKPVLLTYKANVYQSTGYDWKNVKLTVSTGNPSVNNSRPILYPLYATFYNPNVYNYKSGAGIEKEMQMSQLNIALEASERSMDKVLRETAAAPPEYVVETNVTYTSAVYEILLLQDIPSDAKHHLVAMKDYKLPASYQYHTVPKLDRSAFLLAKVTDYGQYNLLPGTANIFFEDVYVGQSTLNPVVVSDTLLLSLGRDEKIVVKRMLLKDYATKKLIGATVKDTKAYEIAIRNNKSSEISIEILDQIPLSQNKEIIIELEDQGEAMYLKDYGKLSWNCKLKPGETKKLRFIYSVKYPKDKNVRGI